MSVIDWSKVDSFCATVSIGMIIVTLFLIIVYLASQFNIFAFGLLLIAIVLFCYLIGQMARAIFRYR